MSASLAKPSYQPWNEEDFQSDIYVRVMSPIQRWMYRTLLQSSFFHTTRPYLPNDDNLLWVLAGCESMTQWEDNKDLVLQRFQIVDGNPDLLENKRVNKDWEKLQEYRQKMSNLGKKSAAQRTFNARSTSVELSSTSYSNSNSNNESKEIEKAEDDNEMALSDKLKNMIFEYSGKVPKLPDYLVKAFRERPGGERNNLNALREYLHNNPGMEYPLHSFLDTEPEDVYVRPAVSNGTIQDEKVLSLAAKIFTISDLALSGKSLIAAQTLLKKYKEEEILNAFRYFYSKLDAFYQKNAVRDFFEKGASESVVLSMREYVAHQEEIVKKAETVPVAPIGRPRNDNEEEEGIEIDF